MTREEAITLIKSALKTMYLPKSKEYISDLGYALEMAIKALEQSKYNSIKTELNGDMISRQAVRHILNHEVKMPIKVWKKLFELVDCLPSVNPQAICEEREKGECPYYAG